MNNHAPDKSPKMQASDILPLSDFQRNAKASIGRLRRTRRPQVLTVNGRAAVVVQDASAYLDMLQLLAEAEEAAAVQEALRDLKAGRGRSLSEFAREFRSRKASRPKRRRSA